MTTTVEADGPTVERLTQAVPADSRCQLEREYREMFPRDQPNELTGFEWQSAFAHGATLEWAWRVANTNTKTNAGRFAITTRFVSHLVRCALRIASVIPVDDVDGLLRYSWTLLDLQALFGLERCDNRRAKDATGLARRLLELHQAAPKTGEPDDSMVRYALLAALLADPGRGLTDLQALRWFQVVVPQRQIRWASQVDLAMRFADDNAAVFQEWVLAAGPDGWVWPAAGFTLDETRRLLALSVGHPDRPGPDQLAVMAALRDR